MTSVRNGTGLKRAPEADITRLSRDLQRKVAVAVFQRRLAVLWSTGRQRQIGLNATGQRVCFEVETKALGQGDFVQALQRRHSLFDQFGR